MLPSSWVEWTLAVSSLYLLAVAVAAIATALRTGGRREETIATDDTRAVSRFTIPVSIVVPAQAGGPELTRAITELLALNYPELEIIVVLDARAAGGIDALIVEWQLEAHEFFFRRSIRAASVRRIYRSGRDPRVVILDVPSTNRADACNAAINVARYRYVATVPLGLTFDRNALLRVMAAPMRDPSTVVGASAHVERTGAFARLASMRSTAASRLLWRHLECAPPPADSVNVWRRDAVLEAGGFSPLALDADLDLTQRVVVDRRGRSGRFYRSAEYFGQASTAVVSGPKRWLAAWQFARVLTPGGIRAFGLRSLAAFFGLEVFVPLAQLWLVTATVTGALVGRWGWTLPVIVLVALALVRAAVTTAALLTRGSGLAAPEGGELTRLLAIAPLEPLIRLVRP